MKSAVLGAAVLRDRIAENLQRLGNSQDYPLLEPGDITAALEYAARQSDHPVFLLVGYSAPAGLKGGEFAKCDRSGTRRAGRL